MRLYLLTPLLPLPAFAHLSSPVGVVSYVAVLLMLPFYVLPRAAALRLRRRCHVATSRYADVPCRACYAPATLMRERYTPRFHAAAAICPPARCCAYDEVALFLPLLFTLDAAARAPIMFMRVMLAVFFAP